MTDLALKKLLPRVVQALAVPGAAAAFAHYQKASELLAAAVLVGEPVEDEDVDVLDSPRFARVTRSLVSLREDLDNARAALSETLGENRMDRDGHSLGAALRAAPPEIVRAALPLVTSEIARTARPENDARTPEDDDDLASGTDPVPDPRLEKKTCSCGRRVRAYLFFEHTQACAGVDRTPIVDRDTKPEKEDPVPKLVTVDPARIVALRAAGKSHEEISAELKISKATVQRRLSESGGGGRAPKASPKPAGTVLPDGSAFFKTTVPSPAPSKHCPDRDVVALAKCIELLRPLDEAERRAVVYFLGARYTAPASA